MADQKRLVILGSTGSIGRNTLKIVEAYKEQYQVVGLGGARNVELLLEQVKRFRPQYSCLLYEEDYSTYKDEFERLGCQLLWGKDGYRRLAALDGVDTVVSAMVGAAGLVPTLSAVEAGKCVALANKESLVVAGHIVMASARKHGAKILPVDSEHSAIFQCLNGEKRETLRCLILTASGGPFWELSKEAMEEVGVDDALRHPNWSMGAKITIDSATMMNKGLEVIEARWLFDVEVDKIKVLVHRQSIVHSMVEFVDGAIMAQLGSPDMRIPIAYALSWPERLDLDVERISLTKIAELTFEEPDFGRFPLLALGFEAAQRGGNVPVVLNAANEMAVEAFLRREIGFGAIWRVVEMVTKRIEFSPCDSIEEVQYWDGIARLYAEEAIRKEDKG